MKKFFLTGAAVILVILLGIGIYIDHRRENKYPPLVSANSANSNNTGVQQPVAAPGYDESAINTVDNTAAANNSAAAPAPVAIARRHRRPKHQSQVALPAGEEEMTLNATDPENPADNSADPVSAGSSEYYTGNVPAPAVAQPVPAMPAAPMQTVKKSPVESKKMRMVHFGPEIGIMDNSFMNVPTQNMDRIGLRAGGVVDFRLGGHFSIQPGLMYELKGEETHSVVSNDMTAVDTKDKISLNYLELPLDAIVKIGPVGEGQLMVGGGAYVAYLLSDRDRYTVTTTTYGNPASRTTQILPAGDVSGSAVREGANSIPIGSQEASTSLRRLDWGLNGFVGCQLPMGFNAKIGADVGMMDIQHNPNGSYNDRNLNFFLSLGYLLGYGK